MMIPANEPKNPPSPKDSKSGKTISTPESEAAARINDLQARLASLKQEIKTIQGRMANRNPQMILATQKENDLLKARIEKLKSALFTLVMDSYKPRSPDEAELNYENLRRASVDYFKKANIAPEIWKNIES